MHKLSVLLFFALAFLVRGSDAPGAAFAAQWQKAPPFYFEYGGKPSTGLLAGWQRGEDAATPSDSGQVRHYWFVDPVTKLKITADVRTYTDFDAVDWVLHFTNGGTGDTPLLQDIEALHTAIPADQAAPVVHSASGGSYTLHDYMPRGFKLGPGGSYVMGTARGKSSEGLGGLPGANGAGSLPMFNLDFGDHGLLGGLGWTGNYRLTLAESADGRSIDLRCGQLKTHLVLHPGETIRTPRIVLLGWKAPDWNDAQNIWRRFLLAHYSPRDRQGRTVTMPIADGTWGTELASAKLARIAGFRDKKIPVDVFWIDAGWYGKLPLPPGKTVDGHSDWQSVRGSWSTNPALYPGGFKPIGDLCRSAGIGFLVWMECGCAMPGSEWATAHPDWYLREQKSDQPGMTSRGWQLNYGNPEALKGLVDFWDNKMIREDGITWYRQDMNQYPSPFWTAADTEDRQGMTENHAVTGMYAFWDALLSHPGFQIDNCAGGGTCLDLETLPRSVCLWRSDLAANPVGEQMHTQGLCPWVPLSAGVWSITTEDADPPGSPVQVYKARSAYCAGLTFNGEYPPGDWMIQAFDEFREVRPFFQEDFYALFPYSDKPGDWAGYQLDRPARKDGVLLLFRRPESAYCAWTLSGLHRIDPAARYQVEVRTTLAHTAPQTMTGAAFQEMTVSILDKPGSALVFYKKL